MDSDFENIFKLGVAVLVVVLLLDADGPFVVELAREQKMVGWFNFEIVAGTKGMQLSGVSVIVFDISALLHSKANDIDSIFIQDHEIIGGQNEAFDGCFPKLVGLVPVLNYLSCEVDANGVESVDSDHLKTHNQTCLFFVCLFIDLVHKVAVAVRNVEFILPMQQVLTSVSWVFGVNDKQIQTKFFVFLVHNNIELVILESHALDFFDLFLLVIIVFFIICNVKESNIFSGANNCHCLSGVHLSVVRNGFQLMIEDKEFTVTDFSLFIVEGKNTIHVKEQDLIWVIVVKLELWANFLKREFLDLVECECTAIVFSCVNDNVFNLDFVS